MTGPGSRSSRPTSASWTNAWPTGSGAGASAALEDDRVREVSWAVGVEPARLGESDREALGSDELRERVTPARDERRASRPNLLPQARRDLAERPDARARSGDADRSVPVLHGCVGLGPDLR